MQLRRITQLALLLGVCGCTRTQEELEPLQEQQPAGIRKPRVQRVMDLGPGNKGSVRDIYGAARGGVFFTAATRFSDVPNPPSDSPPPGLWWSDGTPEGTRLLKDSTSLRFSFSEEVTASGGFVYFGDSAPDTGSELWRSDGTPEGTRLVADLLPGPGLGVGNPAQMLDVNGTLFFTATFAQPGGSGNELQALYTTDGTGAVTTLYEGEVTPYGKTNPRELTRVGEHVFFVTSSPRSAQTRLLWKSDGTREGTVTVSELSTAPESAPTMVGNLVAVGDLLYFTTGPSISTPAGPKTEYRELWKSDGTPEGTTLVTDLTSAGTVLESYKRPLFAVGKLLFFMTEASGSVKLWRTDGTAAGTVLLLDGMTPGVVRLLATEGTLYFAAARTGQPGLGLWKSDGTPEGTTLLEELPASARRVEYLSGGVEGPLYFSVAGDQDFALWKSDGTPGGTVLVKDVPTGVGRASKSGALLDRNIGGAGGHFFFAVNEGLPDLGLWTSDGTPEGTTRLGVSMGGGVNRGSFTLGETLFFRGSDPQHGIELWKSDGTKAGTSLVRDLNTLGTDSESCPLLSEGDSVYFKNADRIWRSDGTPEGTRTSDKLSFTYGPYEYAQLSGAFYVFVGNELWRTNGTDEGTRRVKSFPTRITANTVWTPLVVENTLYFPVRDELGYGWWRTDGTEQGTSLFQRTPGKTSAITAMGRSLYYYADEALWRSDGVAGDAVRLVDVRGGESPPALLVMNGALYLLLDPGGFELWKLEEGGTGARLVQVASGPGVGWRDTSPAPKLSAGVMGGLMYFTAPAATLPYDAQLWRSDGTPEGTFMLFSPPTLHRSTELVFADGTLYFFAPRHEPGRPSVYTLYRSDGTVAGTVPVKEFNPGANARKPWALTRLGKTLYFQADDGRGSDLWRSDGTPQGTVRVRDLLDQPESLARSPLCLRATDKSLIFNATDEAAGRELWMLQP